MNTAFTGRLLAFVFFFFYTIATALVAKLYEDRLWMELESYGISVY